MKQTIVLSIVLISLIGTPTYGQPKYGAPKDSTNFEATINPDHFLAGTFSDYLGRFQYIDKATQIDKYYPYEEPLATFIGNFLIKHYSIQAAPQFEESRNSIILSPALASRLHNEYFDAKGSFIYGKLDTEEKKYSYLAGVYYRFGEQLEGNIYKLQLANSPKAKQLYQLLNDLECDKIVHKFLRGNIPSSDIYYFVATPRMIRVLQFHQGRKSGTSTILLRQLAWKYLRRRTRESSKGNR